MMESSSPSSLAAEQQPEESHPPPNANYDDESKEAASNSIPRRSNDGGHEGSSGRWGQYVDNDQDDGGDDGHDGDGDELDDENHVLRRLDDGDGGSGGDDDENENERAAERSGSLPPIFLPRPDSHEDLHDGSVYDRMREAADFASGSSSSEGSDDEGSRASPTPHEEAHGESVYAVMYRSSSANGGIVSPSSSEEGEDEEVGEGEAENDEEKAAAPPSLPGPIHDELYGPPRLENSDGGDVGDTKPLRRSLLEEEEEEEFRRQRRGSGPFSLRMASAGGSGGGGWSGSSSSSSSDLSFDEDLFKNSDYESGGGAKVQLASSSLRSSLQSSSLRSSLQSSLRSLTNAMGVTSSKSATAASTTFATTTTSTSLAKLATAPKAKRRRSDSAGLFWDVSAPGDTPDHNEDDDDIDLEKGLLGNDGKSLEEEGDSEEAAMLAAAAAAGVAAAAVTSLSPQPEADAQAANTEGTSEGTDSPDHSEVEAADAVARRCAPLAPEATTTDDGGEGGPSETADSSAKTLRIGTTAPRSSAPAVRIIATPTPSVTTQSSVVFKPRRTPVPSVTMALSNLAGPLDDDAEYVFGRELARHVEEYFASKPGIRDTVQDVRVGVDVLTTREEMLFSSSRRLLEEESESESPFLSVVVTMVTYSQRTSYRTPDGHEPAPRGFVLGPFHTAQLRKAFSDRLRRVPFDQTEVFAKVTVASKPEIEAASLMPARASLRKSMNLASVVDTNDDDDEHELAIRDALAVASRRAETEVGDDVEEGRGGGGKNDAAPFMHLDEKNDDYGIKKDKSETSAKCCTPRLCAPHWSRPLAMVLILAAMFAAGFAAVRASSGNSNGGGNSSSAASSFSSAAGSSAQDTASGEVHAAKQSFGLGLDDVSNMADEAAGAAAATADPFGVGPDAEASSLLVPGFSDESGRMWQGAVTEAGKDKDDDRSVGDGGAEGNGSEGGDAVASVASSVDRRGSDNVFAHSEGPPAGQ